MLGENIKDYMKKAFKEAIDQECEISIKKEKNGEAHTCIKGSTLAILITLAGLEKGILEKLGCDESMFEFVKGAVGTEEAK